MKVWRLSDINSLLKNVFHAVMKGEFLLRLNVGKYFIHIIYTFFLFGMVIWTSLAIETTMAKVERNKAVLRKALEHARHGLARRADVLSDLLVRHADGGRAGALGFGEKKGRKTPVKALE